MGKPWPWRTHPSPLFPGNVDLARVRSRRHPWRRIKQRARTVALPALWPLSSLTRAMGAWLRRRWLPTPHDNDPLEFAGFDWPAPKPHREWGVRHDE